MTIYKPKEFAKLLNVSVKTLQRWDTEGNLVAHRNIKNRRYYTHEQYIIATNQNTDTAKKVVIYARVSTANQKDDLQNQIEFLQKFANANGIIVDNVISDIGSGLNYSRRKWNELIKSCMQNEISTIIISNKDRFIRFGYDWFEQLLSSYGVKILVVNNEKLSPNEELVQDLISIINVFSCKIYGLRKYKNKIKEDTDVKSI